MKNMRVLVTEYGGTEKLGIVEEPLRGPAADEVRVQVRSAGVALADVMRREGKYPGTPTAPFVPGYDAIGIVDETGADVQGYARGDRVAVFYDGIGGYASYVYAKEPEIYPVPAIVDDAAATAVILNYVTAYQLIHRLANVGAGDRVLVHGASGGTGSALLEIGRLAGLRMYGTASAAKHDIVASLGAVPIDYRKEDFVEVIRREVPDGVDAVFDPIGGSNWTRSYRTLNAGGRFIGYGYTTVMGQGDSVDWLKDWTALSHTKQTPQGNPASLYSITTLRKEHPDWFREDLAHVFDMLAAGKINPLIAARFPLRDAARAHTLLETSQIAGKIVLIGN